MSDFEKTDYNIQNLDSSKIFIGTEVLTGCIVPSYETKCEIRFHDNKNNKTFRFSPKEDITTFELSHVFRLWAWAFTSGWSYVDISTFIKENGIERHFTEQ